MEKNKAKGEREKNEMNKRKTKKKNPTLGNNGAIIIKENTFIAPRVFLSQRKIARI